MKRILLLATLLTLAVSACAPAANVIAPQCPTGYECKRLTTGWSVTADSSKTGFVIGSSESITGKSSTAPCKFRTVAAGRDRALECNAPNRVIIDTRGEIQVLTLDRAPVSTP